MSIQFTYSLCSTFFSDCPAFEYVYSEKPSALQSGFLFFAFYFVPKVAIFYFGVYFFSLASVPSKSTIIFLACCNDIFPAKLYAWRRWEVRAFLTRSLPRDVYIRRQNDHPGGQGRIYTSHLNFVSTHLSKPGHRRGCCCMSPRCLLRQFLHRCLLFWAFFIEKTVLLCFARFLSKWRETALWLFPDPTSWYELYVWRRSRRELSWFRLVESEGYEWRWIFAGRGN